MGPISEYRSDSAAGLPFESTFAVKPLNWVSSERAPHS